MVMSRGQRLESWSSAFYLENKKLREENMELKKTLTFYATNKNWYNHHNIDKSDAGIREDDLSTIDGKMGVYVGGKRARQVLEKRK